MTFNTNKFDTSTDITINTKKYINDAIELFNIGWWNKRDESIVLKSSGCHSFNIIIRNTDCIEVAIVSKLSNGIIQFNDVEVEPGEVGGKVPVQPFGNPGSLAYRYAPAGNDKSEQYPNVPDHNNNPIWPNININTAYPATSKSNEIRPSCNAWRNARVARDG